MVCFKIISEVQKHHSFVQMVDEMKDVRKIGQIHFILSYYYNEAVEGFSCTLKMPSILQLCRFVMLNNANPLEIWTGILNFVGQCYDGASVMRGNNSCFRALVKANKAFNVRCPTFMSDLLPRASYRLLLFSPVQKLYLHLASHLQRTCKMKEHTKQKAMMCQVGWHSEMDFQ